MWHATWRNVAAVARRQVARTWRDAQGGARREVTEIDGMTDGRVSIKVAADRLGISQDAVRRRLKSGELVGEKETTPQGFVWRVELPADTPEVEPRGDDGVPAPGIITPDPPLAAIGEEMVELIQLRERMAATTETVVRLDAEVTYLRDQLDQRGQELEQRSRELAAERERADVIQQLALQRIEALTATVAEQREDAPERAAEPPGRDEGVSEGSPSSWWGRTWRRVIGGG